jgi:hypothetical protein
MSRILRRPMFRGGGPVNSYGTGIAAPLVPGYQGGGQIGGGIIYGIPHSDGRFGFQEPILPNLTVPNNILTNVEKSLGGGTGITTGSKLLRAANQKLRGDNAYTLPPGVAMKETETESETDDGTKKKSFEEIMMENNQYGDQNPFKIEDNTMSGKEKLIETYTPQPSKKLIDLLSKESTYQDQDGNVRSTVTGEIIKGEGRKFEGMEGEIIGDPREPLPDSKEVKTPGDGKPTIKETEESLSINPKDAIEANQKLFAELLGADKARGQDISDMLLRFSGSGGDTIGEKFQNYVRAESAAGPSRSEKIKQTAAGLAINDYVAGKRSAEQIQKLKEVESFRSKLSTDKFVVNPSTDSWREALDKTVLKYGGKEGKSGDVGIIAETIKYFEPGQKVFREDGISDKKSKSKDFYEDLEIGITIITLKNGSKKIIKKTGENSFDDITNKYPV